MLINNKINPAGGGNFSSSERNEANHRANDKVSACGIGNKPRLDYIDLVKGIMMIGVVWFHSRMYPHWITGLMLNSTFFFVSGFFFSKKGGFASFLKKKTTQLLIPFIFFYLLSYLFRIIVELWDQRTISNFNWFCLFDIFNIEERCDYLSINAPLWFILALMWIQIIYYYICRFPKWVLVSLSVGLALCTTSRLSVAVPMPFMINGALGGLPFFIMGNILGKSLIKSVERIKTRSIVMIVSAVCYTICCLIDDIPSSIKISHFIQSLGSIPFCGLLISIAAWFDGKKIVLPLRIIGLNTLPLLCLHILPLVFFDRLGLKLFGESYLSLTLVNSLLAITVSIFIIEWLALRWPRLVARKTTIKSNSNISANNALVSNV